MKTLFTLAVLAVTTIASAQPGHGRKHGNGHYKKHNKHKVHHYDKKDYKHGRRVVRTNHRRDYNYHVQQEMARYNFLRLSQAQRSRLQVSLNFLISNDYGPRDYEYRLRKDLRNILSRSQYDLWERKAYNNGGTTFVFNFNR
nr:hypothetical protein [uncultured Flavobacterium sp.]